jgi:hypothetical protein
MSVYSRLALLLAFAFLSGCAAHPQDAVVGEWDGGFQVNDRATDQLTGSLDLYGETATIPSQDFHLHLTTGMQDFYMFGRFQLSGKQLVLRSEGFSAEGTDKAQIQMLRYLYFDPKVVQSELGSTITLNRDTANRWIGPKTALGPIHGRLVFAFNRNAL